MRHDLEVRSAVSIGFMKGDSMTDMQPRFFDTENKLIVHLEWEAIRILCFEGSHMNIVDAFPKFD